MPELPEVETVMRGLRQRLEGRIIARATANRADMRWPFPEGLQKRLTGARVTGFRRRGKYILMRLAGGDSLLLHLGMSGRMVLSPVRPNQPTPHEHLVLETDDGWRMGFVDPRRFGSVDLVPTRQEDGHQLLAGLGPEPLDATFSPARLSAALAGKRTPIKAALLDQKVVAGLGNIYVSEALFRARLSPRRSAAHHPWHARRTPGAGDQGHAERGDRRGRIIAARLRPAGRRTGLFPARLESLRPRRRSLRALSRPPRLPRHPPHHAVGPQHLLLPAHPALATSRPPPAGNGKMAKAFQNILVETHGRVGLIRLNRPQR